MKALLNRIVDKLQETFPPNRIAVLLGGLITAFSGTVAAWLATHFPGLDLGAPEVAGVLGAAVLITARLLDRWIDRWQEQERIDFDHDLEAALEEFAGGPELEALLDAVDTFGTLGRAVTGLRNQIAAGTVNEAEVARELEAIAVEIGEALYRGRGLIGEEAEEPEAPMPPAAEPEVAERPAPGRPEPEPSDAQAGGSV